MAKITLTPPWLTYYHELQALFKEDPTVRVLYDENEYEVKLYVEEAEKAELLYKYLKSEENFGNITLKVTVVPANHPKKTGYTNLSPFEIIFKDNAAVSYVHTVNGIIVKDLTYVVFKNKVVQFYTDDIGDINGYCSTLYEDIAREVFTNHEGIFFCTDLAIKSTLEMNNSIGKPLGEWP